MIKDLLKLMNLQGTDNQVLVIKYLIENGTIEAKDIQILGFDRVYTYQVLNHLSKVGIVLRLETPRTPMQFKVSYILDYGNILKKLDRVIEIKKYIESIS